MTIHAKDKVSLFIRILFIYFENRLLPKDIIIISNHGEDEEILVERASKGRPSQLEAQTISSLSPP
jgi:hypothetical protein